MIDDAKAQAYFELIEGKKHKTQEEYNIALQYLIDTGVAQQLAKSINHWAWIMRDAMNNSAIKVKKS